MIQRVLICCVLLNKSVQLLQKFQSINAQQNKIRIKKSIVKNLIGMEIYLSLPKS